MNGKFTFSSKKYTGCVIIEQIFSDTHAKQWPNFQLTVA